MLVRCKGLAEPEPFRVRMKFVLCDCGEWVKDNDKEHLEDIPHLCYIDRIIVEELLRIHASMFPPAECVQSPP